MGDGGLRDLDFNIPKGVTTQQAAMLNLVEKEIPSMSDVDNAGDTKLQEITENAVKSTEDLITQFKGKETLLM